VASSFEHRPARPLDTGFLPPFPPGGRLCRLLTVTDVPPRQRPAAAVGMIRPADEEGAQLPLPDREQGNIDRQREGGESRGIVAGQPGDLVIGAWLVGRTGLAAGTGHYSEASKPGPVSGADKVRRRCSTAGRHAGPDCSQSPITGRLRERASAEDPRTAPSPWLSSPAWQEKGRAAPPQ
jgi:hypothetical protein